MINSDLVHWPLQEETCKCNQELQWSVLQVLQTRIERFNCYMHTQTHVGDDVVSVMVAARWSTEVQICVLETA